MCPTLFDLPLIGLKVPAYGTMLMAGFLLAAWLAQQRAAGLGMVLTRLGCFLNGCCFGHPAEGPWAVRYPAGSTVHKFQVGAGLIAPEATVCRGGPALALLIVFQYMSLALAAAFGAACLVARRVARAPFAPPPKPEVGP